jgi:small subunit ribosomal protein S14
MIERERKRRILASKGKYPKVRLHNRCRRCGRPRGYYRDFGLCRLCLREMAHQGFLPGVVKASW